MTTAITQGVTSETGHRAVDCVEAAILTLPPVEMENEHCFAIPGLYIRQWVGREGTLVTSKIHRCRHPFWVLEGECLVWAEDTGWQRISAPHCGITLPGTRRVIYVVQDCRWVTFHQTDQTDLADIEAELIEFRPPAATVPMDDLIHLAANPIEHANELPAAT